MLLMVNELGAQICARLDDWLPNIGTNSLNTLRLRQKVMFSIYLSVCPHFIHYNYCGRRMAG